MKAKWIAGVLTMLCLLAGPVLRGQTPPADAPKPDATPAAPPAPPVWSAGPIDFSGLVDAYYNINFNHPASQVNQLRNWDTEANQFSLGMAKVVLEHKADPVGFRVDLGFGKAFDIVHGAEPNGGLSTFRNIEQAYGTLNVGKGTLDFGKFVTQHGAEVIETNMNWNYSHSLLFAWAIPYYHFGVRFTYPIAKTFTGAFYVVNGWNNVKDNNSGKTFGFQGVWTPNSHFSWVNNYMVGPENNNTNTGYRHLYDTTATVTVNDKLAVMGNYDWGVNKFGGKAKAEWRGFAGYVKLSPTSWFALIPRGEWYDDHDGFTTGTAQKLKEFTLTAEFKMKAGLMTRFEYRTDFSDQKFFDRGNALAARDTQTTLLAGIIVYFGPKR